MNNRTTTPAGNRPSRRPYANGSLFVRNGYNSIDMLRNYFKIAWRNLLRNKAYSAISITGLAVGVACCLLIALYVKDELSYDRYHKNINETYRVLHAFRNAKGNEKLPPPGPKEFQVWGNAPVGPALKAYFPEILKETQFTSPFTYLVQYGDKRFQEDNLLFADVMTLDVFSWKLLAGNPAEALKAPYSIVLTKSMARKYFGNDNPMGKALKMDNKLSFTVTGVMEDVPSNSHFSFNALMSMNTFRQLWPEIFNWWGYVDFYTYFVVPPHTNINALQARIPDFIERYNPQRNGAYTIAFEPMADAYLRSAAGRQPGPTGSLQNVYIFALIGIFILMIACINFINLSTARSLERAKEVGVRKTVGAFQHGLICQFLTESVLISLIAEILATALVIVLLPLMRNISGKPLLLSGQFSWEVVLALVAAPLVLGLLAGSYPAWVLARFKPVEVLKGKFGASHKGTTLRRGLVVLQFSLSIALIAGTSIVFLQLGHLRSHQLGFRQDQMLVIDYGGDEIVNNKIETIKSVFARQAAVQSVSASRAVPGDFFPNGTTFIETRSGEMQAYDPALYEIDFDFIPAFEMKMAAGRPYSRDFPVDTTQSLLLNEAAAKLYGYADPKEIIGKRFDQWGRKGQVIGVVKDFNYQSLHKKVEPLALRMAPSDALGKLSLRIKSDRLPQTIAELERTWKTLVPHRPFLYSFLDQSFNQQYQQDLRFGELFGAFAALTIFIACLGLFGLATYATEQRIKEIGIRKILGASIAGIVALLSSDFIKLVIIAMLIATPAAWWAMHEWLKGFAYRIDIHWWPFALAGLLAVVIALVTVSFQTVRAALMDPVRSLRSE